MTAPRLAWLDGLRAVAVLLVVYAHLTRFAFTDLRAVTGEWLHAGTAGVMLFSPEISLTLDLPSVTANAPYDVLPWNIPTTSYLHGLDARDAEVSGLDVATWPPTFIADAMPSGLAPPSCSARPGTIGRNAGKTTPDVLL